jgi:hypothetical protein
MNAVRNAVVGTLVLSTAGVAVATASPADPGRGVERIDAVRTTEDRTVLDLGEPGASLGDQQVFTARFEANGKTIGFDGGVCTLVRRPQVFQCVATNRLPRGQITAQALVDFDKAPGPFHFAITGGTETYRTAHGSVDVLFGQENDQVTFRILTRAR